jgi:hypothetical protein
MQAQHKRGSVGIAVIPNGPGAYGIPLKRSFDTYNFEISVLGIARDVSP